MQGKYTAELLTVLMIDGLQHELARAISEINTYDEQRRNLQSLMCRAVLLVHVDLIVARD